MTTTQEVELSKSSEEMQIYFLILHNKATEEEYTQYMTKYAEQGEREMGKPVCKMTDEEFEVYKVLEENLSKGDIKGEYCKVCRNKGYTVRRENGYNYYKECSCMKQRRNDEKLQQSEYSKMLTSKTFENFNLRDDWQAKALRTCKQWLPQSKYPFLFLGGKSGTGKTHLAVATFVAYSRRGVTSKFISWRTESRDLKMRMTDWNYYEPKLNELKKVPLLLIDDFLWSNDNKIPTDEDWRLAKEIIDARGANGLKTILTSNFPLGLLINYSEVVGSRLREYTGGETNFEIEFDLGTQNYRLNGKDYRLIESNSKSPFDD